MKAKDLSVELPGVFIIHQKIRGYEVGEHFHEDEHEFFLPIQGDIRIEVGGRTLKAGPGRMIYLPPRTPHSFCADKHSQGERLILIVKSKTWNRHEGAEFGATMLAASQLCKEVLFQLLLHPKTKAAPALVETLVHTFSEMLEGAVGEGDPSHLGGSTGDDRVKKALSLIEDGFAENISVEKLAKQAGLSVRNLNRLFLTEIGLTPKQVMLRYRIEHAKRMLATGRHSVTDVALEVGYSSVSQFISTFRKATGQLPSSLMPLKLNGN